MSPYRVILTLFLTFSLPLTAIYQDKLDQNQGIYFTIRTSKSNYLLGENAWLKISLINNSEEDYYYTGFFVGGAIRTLVTSPFNNQRNELAGSVDWWPIKKVLRKNDTLIYYHQLNDGIKGGDGNYSVVCSFQNIQSNTISFDITEPVNDDRTVFENIREIHKKVNTNPKYRESSKNDYEGLYYKYPVSPYTPSLYFKIVLNGIITDSLRYEQLYTDFYEKYNNSYEVYYALLYHQFYLEKIKELNSSDINSEIAKLAEQYPGTMTEEVSMYLLKKSK
ncbi:MAG: hypothetical protein KDC73_13480 [Ignavibacteriae bacterium]|nr:hypothetical protein [Ignavibacteriota bacterium]MCB9242725.1 hypothetical protein [Ignavibacteriales bacterium]